MLPAWRRRRRGIRFERFENFEGSSPGELADELANGRSQIGNCGRRFLCARRARRCESE